MQQDWLATTNPFHSGIPYRTEYYTTHFIVTKKDSGHRPILNLKLFNLKCMHILFKMETLVSIIAVRQCLQFRIPIRLTVSSRVFT